MIGIIGAMDVEVEGLKKLVTEPREKQVSKITFVSGKIGERDVVVAKCGIGKVNAGICAEAMILTYSPELIINVGVGGSLTDELDIGDIVAADSVCQHDFDTSPVGDALGLIPEVNEIYIKTDRAALEKLEECIAGCNIKYKVGAIASGDVFVADSEKKKFIVSQFGAIACEMEGAAIGQVCSLNNVPFAVLRALSDGANEESFMDYPEFCRLAAANSAAVLERFMKA